MAYIAIKQMTIIPKFFLPLLQTIWYCIGAVIALLKSIPAHECYENVIIAILILLISFLNN